MMERACFVEVKCGGEVIAIDATKIESLLPGSFRHFGTLAEGAKNITVVQYVSGREIEIDHSLDETLSLIAEATTPETEV